MLYCTMPNSSDRGARIALSRKHNRATRFLRELLHSLNAECFAIITNTQLEQSALEVTRHSRVGPQDF